MADSKRFYWVKLDYRRFENGGDLDFLMSQRNGANYIVLYMMLCLQTRNTEGAMVSIFGGMAIPYDVDKIVRDCKYFSRDTVMIALELYKKLGLIYEQENGVMKIANYEDMVGSETDKASIMRRIRTRKKLGNGNNSGNNVTEMLPESYPQCDQHCYQNVTQEKRDKSKDKENREGEEKIESKTLSKKEEQKKKSATSPLIASFLKERGIWSESLEDSIASWLEMRLKIRKPATDRAIELAIDKAVAIAAEDGCSVADVFDNSTLNSWQGLFHVRDGQQKTAKQNSSRSAMGRDIDRFDGDDTEVIKL